jgi:hypothetical protein
MKQGGIALLVCRHCLSGLHPGLHLGTVLCGCTCRYACWGPLEHLLHS